MHLFHSSDPCGLPESKFGNFASSTRKVRYIDVWSFLFTSDYIKMLELDEYSLLTFYISCLVNVHV